MMKIITILERFKHSEKSNMIPTPGDLEMSLLTKYMFFFSFKRLASSFNSIVRSATLASSYFGRQKGGIIVIFWVNKIRKIFINFFSKNLMIIFI